MINYLHPPAHLLDQPIEPHALQIGDRVRVVLNGECTFLAQRQYPIFGPHGAPAPHSPEFDGRTGVVIPAPLWVDRSLIRADHPYAVKFDDPYFSMGRECEGSHFAACELELLEEDS